MYKKIIRCLVLFGVTAMLQADSDEQLTTDFIIFSCNRPMQLYALLESTEYFITGLKQIHVLYRSTDKKFDAGYNIVKKAFPHVTYIKQDRLLKIPGSDFKPLLINIFNKTDSGYIMFGVDDIVVKESVDIANCIECMRKYNAYGCYLRLCPTIDYMYSWQRPQRVPPLQAVPEGYVWKYEDADRISDWGYPNCVDMTIYRKKDLNRIVRELNYRNPNTFEGQWSTRVPHASLKHGFCYETSKIINFPLNLVQNTHTRNPHMVDERYTPSRLLELFMQGYKIDITPIFGMATDSAHVEYEPTFVLR